jgi:alkylation response protein AidB-like acyl-CoA dehydrogenase
MQLDLDHTHDEFRQEARTWLDENQLDWIRPSEEDPAVRGYDAEWQRRVFDGGWAGIDWPEEFGGRGLSLLQQVIWYEEYAASGAPSRSVFRVGLNHAGPTLIARASVEQKDFHLPRILRGESAWCQGFSEPNAGSDLGSLQTRGIIDGEHIIVTGQKIWTSVAQHCDYQELLIRTDVDVPKHKGITWIIGDMSLDGIEVRPITTIDDGVDFCEVFYDEVRIPLVNVVDGINNGWSVAMANLAIERGPAFLNNRLEWIRVLDDLIEEAGSRGLLDDDVVADRLALLRAETLALRSMAYLLISRATPGQPPDPIASANRLYWSELTQRIARAAVELLGPDVIETGKWSQMFLHTFASTIGGGTSDIQRNVIGERALGLPR